MATFHLIAHTHWDREWYLPRAAFEARLVPLVAEVLDLLEAHPALRFHLDGQAILIEDYLRLVPEHRGRVEVQLSEGRLAVGPWYVLADQLIPSGEALLRNLLIGRTLASQLGDRCNIWYSPDAFGHPAMGPRLARAFGIQNAVVWRGAPAVSDLFLWSDRQGSSVRTYQLPPDGYEIGSSLLGSDRDLAMAWQHIRPGLVARAASSEIAVFVGADHHAPDPALATLVHRLACLEPSDQVRFSSLEEYFDAVARAAPTLQTVSGELRASGTAWLLQGVHGTRLRLKRRYTRAELALTRAAEPLAALSRRGRPALGAAWRRLVAAQFHDTLAGSIADSVAAEQDTRLAAVLAGAAELVRQSLHGLVGHDPDGARTAPRSVRPTLVIWNPTPRARSGVTVAKLTGFLRDILVGPPGGRTARSGPGLPSTVLRDDQGGVVPLQVLRRGEALERIDAARHYPDADLVEEVWVAFRLRDLPGLGVRYLWAPDPLRDQSPPRQPENSVRVEGPVVRSSVLDVRWSGRESLTLTHRIAGQTYRGLASLETSVDQGDCYTPELSRPGIRSGCGAVRTMATGPLVGSLAADWAISEPGGRIVGRTVATVYDGSSLVRLRIEFDNGAPNHRLRCRFPIGIKARVIAGAPFGVERRPPGRVNRSWPNEVRLATEPAHRYVATAVGSRGLAVLSPGFFEYEWTEHGELLVTLVRSVGELSKSTLATRPGHAGWPTATPGAQEPGRHRIELAVAPINESHLADPKLLNDLWEEAFLPPLTYWLRDGLVKKEPFPGIQLDGDGLILEAVKPAETGDGVVFRIVNLLDRASHGRLRFSSSIEGAWKTGADETAPQELALDERGSSLGFDAEPGALLTIVVVGPL